MTTRFSMRKAAGSRSISAPTLLSGAISIRVIWPGLARIVFAIHAIASVSVSRGRGKRLAHDAWVNTLLAFVGTPMNTGILCCPVSHKRPSTNCARSPVLPHAVVTPSSFSSGLVNTRASAYASSMSSPISVSRITFCGAGNGFCAHAYFEPMTSRLRAIIQQHFTRICCHSRAECRFQTAAVLWAQSDECIHPLPSRGESRPQTALSLDPSVLFPIWRRMLSALLFPNHL